MKARNFTGPASIYPYVPDSSREQRRSLSKTEHTITFQLAIHGLLTQDQACYSIHYIGAAPNDLLFMRTGNSYWLVDRHSIDSSLRSRPAERIRHTVIGSVGPSQIPCTAASLRLNNFD